VIEKGRIKVYPSGKTISRGYYDFPIRFPWKSEGDNEASIAEKDLIRYIQMAIRDPSPKGEMNLDAAFGPCPILGMDTSDRPSVPFDEAVPNAARIVVGKVRQITKHDGFRVATFDVEQTLKGSPTKELRFLATPTWNLDLSGAQVGERLILLLNQAASDPVVEKLTAKAIPDLYRIDNDGAGRLIVKDGRIEVFEFGGELSSFHYKFPLRFPRKMRARYSATISERDVISSIQKALHQPAKR
jgi:hypothetical protein